MSILTRAVTGPLALTLALVSCTDDTTTPQEGAGASPQASVAASTGRDHSLVNGGEIQWGDAPPCFLPGAKLAVIEGNPFEAGKVWTIRVLLPDGYVVDPHWHPTDESVTVLSGTFLFGHGEHFDESGMTAYGKGGFVTAPAEMPHYVKARGRTEIQVHGLGPFALIYVEHGHGDAPDCPIPTS